MKDKKKQVVDEQPQSPKVITWKPFINEHKHVHYTNVSSQPMHQSHHLKMHIESPTPRDRLSLEPTTSQPKKKVHAFQQMLIVESKKINEEMEIEQTQNRMMILCT